jgi:Elongation factor Tu domain 2
MFRMTVDDVFSIRGRGTVVTGQIEEGTLQVGDEVRINDTRQVKVDGIEAFRKTLKEANAGDNVGVLLRALGRDDIKRGDVLSRAGEGAGMAPAVPAAPAAPAAAPGRDPRFGQAEEQRREFLSMRDAGLMTEAQIDESLRALIFAAGGRQWLLKAGGDSWYSSVDGQEWRPDSPP